MLVADVAESDGRETVQLIEKDGGTAAFTRVDAAAFFKLTPKIEAQINVENLLDSSYFSSAYNDNNIMPGAPTTARATVRMSF